MAACKTGLGPALNRKRANVNVTLLWTALRLLVSASLCVYSPMLNFAKVRLCGGYMRDHLMCVRERASVCDTKGRMEQAMRGLGVTEHGARYGRTV